MTQKGMTALQERRLRVSTAHKILLSKPRRPIKEAVALLSYNLGITERKAKEYIDTLIAVDGIRYDGDFIVRGKSGD